MFSGLSLTDDLGSWPTQRTSSSERPIILRQITELPPIFLIITELPPIFFIITQLPPIELGLFLPLQQPIESCAMGLALIGNYILLLVLIFNADLCVNAAHKAILLMHAPRLARDSSTAYRLLVAKFQRTYH
jgi:hypothetical protein